MGCKGRSWVWFRNRDDGSIVLLVLNGSGICVVFGAQCWPQFRIRAAASAVATFTWRPRAPSS